MYMSKGRLGLTQPLPPSLGEPGISKTQFQKIDVRHCGYAAVHTSILN